jgi:hypothetical protein
VVTRLFLRVVAFGAIRCLLFHGTCTVFSSSPTRSAAVAPLFPLTHYARAFEGVVGPVMPGQAALQEGRTVEASVCFTGRAQGQGKPHAKDRLHEPDFRSR